jgi:hypothetical protein
VNEKVLIVGALVLVGGAVAGVSILSGRHDTDDGVLLVDANTPPEQLADAAKQRDPGAKKGKPGDEHRPLEELVKECLPSVALVKGKIGHGAGFLLPQRVLATNAHVVALEFEENIRVYFPSAPKGQQGPYPAEFLWADRKRDIAFLHVDCDVEPLELAEEYTLRPGQEVIAIGSPGLGNNEMLPNAPTRGLMSNLTKLNGETFYALSISVNPGNSGGPVIDMQGRVLGMITAKMRDKEGIAFAVPLEDLYSGYHQRVLWEGREAGPELLSWLRACTVFERLIYLGEEYILGLDAYAQAMAAATARGGTPNDGLRAVSKEMEPRIKMTDRIFGDALEKNVAVVTVDPLIFPGDRARIADLWHCCRDMKAMIDQPRGTLDAYRARKDQLKRFYRELTNLKEQPRRPPKKVVPKMDD